MQEILEREREISEREFLSFSISMVDIPSTSELPQSKPWWKESWVGTLAQWGAVVALILFNLVNSHSQHASEDFDLRTDKRIDAKLNPVSDGITGQLNEVISRLDKLDQWKEDIQTQYKSLKQNQAQQDRNHQQLAERFDQFASLERLRDPRRILATIRFEIERAQENNIKLPAPELTDYKNALRSLPISEADYWATVAAVINYQSQLDQMSGAAPDPSKIARSCGNMTDSLFIGLTFNDCVLNVDNNLFRDTVFRNSVVHYHGGSVALFNVTFENCLFVLDLDPGKPVEHPELLLALLRSPDQKNIKVSR